MAKMHYLFLGLISIALCLLMGNEYSAVRGEERAYAEKPDVRQRIVELAQREIGVRELTGNNDGERVEEYLAYTKLGKGYEWCAAFVCWCFGQAGLAAPRNPWCPALFPKSKQYRSPKGLRPADLFGIYGASAKRINHVGLVKAVDGQYIVSIEGNSANSVLSKRRLTKTIYAFANWLD